MQKSYQFPIMLQQYIKSCRYTWGDSVNIHITSEWKKIWIVSSVSCVEYFRNCWSLGDSKHSLHRQTKICPLSIKNLFMRENIGKMTMLANNSEKTNSSQHCAPNLGSSKLVKLHLEFGQFWSSAYVVFWSAVVVHPPPDSPVLCILRWFSDHQSSYLRYCILPMRAFMYSLSDIEQVR